MVNRLVVGSFLALILGFSVGMPVLFKTVTFGEQPRVYADVVYAYFSLLPSNQSVSGLQREQLISFLFVLNVTNLSNEAVEITSVDVMAAGEITFVPATDEGGITHFNETLKPNVEWSNVTQVVYVGASGALGYGSSDNIVTRSESFEGSEYYWPENTSRLVALSGMVDVSESGLTAMQTSKIFVFSHVEGKAYSSDVMASGAYVIKGVLLETAGDREFVFNELLKANETLRVQYDGTGVTIVSGK